MFWLLLLVLMGYDVPERVGDEIRIDECQCLRLVLADLRITTSIDTSMESMYGKSCHISVFQFSEGFINTNRIIYDPFEGSY